VARWRRAKPQKAGKRSVNTRSQARSALRHDVTLTAEERDHAVDEFIELFAAVDGILQARAAADVGYISNNCWRTARPIEAAFLAAYRWQYIHLVANRGCCVIAESQGPRLQSGLATLR
jgi:hypothetical protein